MNRFWTECVKAHYQFSDWLKRQRRKVHQQSSNRRHYATLTRADAASDGSSRPRERKNVNWRDSIGDAGDQRIDSPKSSVDTDEDECGGSVKNVEQVIIAGGEEEVILHIYLYILGRRSF